MVIVGAYVKHVAALQKTSSERRETECKRSGKCLKNDFSCFSSDRLFHERANEEHAEGQRKAKHQTNETRRNAQVLTIRFKDPHQSDWACCDGANRSISARIGVCANSIVALYGATGASTGEPGVSVSGTGSIF